jgi:hypothetical protein
VTGLDMFRPQMEIYAKYRAGYVLAVPGFRPMREIRLFRLRAVCFVQELVDGIFGSAEAVSGCRGFRGIERRGCTG